MTITTTYRPFLNKEDSGIDLVGLAQEQHYSLSREVRLGNAWGLSFSITQAPPSGAGGLDRFTYNSKELLTDLDLGWNDYGFRMYDASVGRWSAVDPLAEKFLPSTPFEFVVNSPILLEDPDGRDWTITIDYDKKGNISINIRLDAAILNSSGKSIDMRNLMKNEIASFERIFNSSEKGFKVTAELNLRSIIGKNQVKENEHLIEILPGNLMEKNEIGDGPIGGKYVKLNSDYIGSNGQFYEGKNETGIERNGVLAHELGHTGGLIHPFQFPELNTLNQKKYKNYKYENGNTIFLRGQEDNINRDNFMNYPSKVSSDLKVRMNFINRPGKATKEQIISIYSAYYWNNLNYNNLPK